MPWRIISWTRDMGLRAKGESSQGHLVPGVNKFFHRLFGGHQFTGKVHDSAP